MVDLFVIFWVGIWIFWGISGCMGFKYFEFDNCIGFNWVEDNVCLDFLGENSLEIGMILFFIFLVLVFFSGDK